MSHTKGPWIVVQDNGWQTIRTSTMELVAGKIDETYATPCGMEDRANALLIAAAPDLLAACKELKARTEAVGRLLLKPGGHTREECELAMALIQARDAIAKAEGLDTAQAER